MSSFSPAVRAGVGLLIGIAGETGSGKTFSALRLARGLAGGDDQAIAFIDTEAGRALHYAGAAGEKPGGAIFGFQHCDLGAPFSPEAYSEKIAEADRAGFRVIVIDSFSHEWDGEGGCADIHDADLDEMVERSRQRANGAAWWNEASQREKLSISAWKGAKLRHKRMVSRLLQCRAHLVICMRAEDKLRIEGRTEQGRNGREFAKTEITPAAKLPPRERWQPICEKRFPFQLITLLIVTPDAPGVPIALKLQQQHRSAVREDCPLDERAGELLAAWARGDAPACEARGGGAAVAPSPSTPHHFAGAAFDPARPANLAIPIALAELESGDWRLFVEALRDLIKAAPDAEARRCWLASHDRELLYLRGLHPNWAAGLEGLAAADSADETAPVADAVRGALANAP
jgi:AAA domain